MAVHARFRRGAVSMPLNAISMTGHGTEALKGLTGLGLPPVSTQWVTGAGDGATYRGERKQPRDLDIPLHILMPDRDGLEAEMSRVSLMVMQGPFQFDIVEDSGDYWTTEVVRVGGGDIAYGETTDGEHELTTVLTVRAGDPWFTSQREQSAEVSNAGAGRGLLATGVSLTKMRVSASSAIGDMLLANEGDAPAWPLWTITGPGTNLVVSDGVHTFEWNGTLAAGEVLLIDTKTASARTSAGVNKYGDFAAAPRFWRLEPGQTLAHVSMDGTTGDSAIKATWRARKWWVV